MVEESSPNISKGFSPSSTTFNFLISECFFLFDIGRMYVTGVMILILYFLFNLNQITLNEANYFLFLFFLIIFL